MNKSILINGESPSKGIKMDNPQQAQTIWAYMAGIIDGEGCISIARYKQCRTYKVELIVVQKHEALIMWLYDNISSSRKPDIVERKKSFKGGLYWRWSVSNSEVSRILKNCLPYLVEKKMQAVLAIELLETKSKNRGRKGEYLGVLKRHEEIFTSVKMLKKNGAAAETERMDSEGRSDSPNCRDDKPAEVAEMTTRLIN